MTEVSKLKLKLLSLPGPQYIVAEYCGFNKTRLAEYSTLKRKIPPKHLLALCRVLKCEPEDILGPADSEEFDYDVEG